MKIGKYIALLFFLMSCTSPDQIANNRNAYFRDYNAYEKSRFWRTIDIDRFEHNQAAVRFAILAEEHTIHDMQDQSYLRAIRDSLHHVIEARNEAFQELKSTYFDTSAAARRKIFTRLKSDSLDRKMLEGYQDSPYGDLFEDLFHRYRTAIRQCRFYKSQPEFEDYLKTRSFTAADRRSLEKIFDDRVVEREQIRNETNRLLKEMQIDFLIFFRVSYSSDYSDEAGARIGAEHVNLACYSVATGETICKAARIHFLKNESGKHEHQ